MLGRCIHLVDVFHVKVILFLSPGQTLGGGN
jgi:hypothetical protein